MPQCDSSQTYTRAVWLLPSPADLPSLRTAGVSEVSRFSCTFKYSSIVWAGLGWAEVTCPCFRSGKNTTNFRGDLMPSFGTKLSMIFAKERGTVYVEKQAHRSADDRGIKAGGSG
jgi:hypothetical protein